jgi:transposase, IS5 family
VAGVEPVDRAVLSEAGQWPSPIGVERLKIATGTIVDATIINPPCSTKNAERARDPEMHRSKKGNQWYFGMKAHFGVDSRTKPIHSAVATPANVADGRVLPELLHGNEASIPACRWIIASSQPQSRTRQKPSNRDRRLTPIRLAGSADERRRSERV